MISTAVVPAGVGRFGEPVVGKFAAVGDDAQRVAIVGVGVEFVPVATADGLERDVHFADRPVARVASEARDDLDEVLSVVFEAFGWPWLDLTGLCMLTGLTGAVQTGKDLISEAVSAIFVEPSAEFVSTIEGVHSDAEYMACEFDVVLAVYVDYAAADGAHDFAASHYQDDRQAVIAIDFAGYFDVLC